MADKKQVKTNAMRILDQHRIPYQIYERGAMGQVMNAPTAPVFKTLVVRGKSGQIYVFVVPLDETLDLKKAAQVTGEKYIEMVLQKELLPLTGYVHGGCSPIGMKKQFKTFIHHSVDDSPTIICSAGKVALQLEIAGKDLIALLQIRVVDVACQ